MQSNFPSKRDLGCSKTLFFCSWLWTAHVQDLAAAAPDLKLTNTEWAEVLAAAMKQPYEVTFRLQAAALTPGLLLKEWMALKSFATDPDLV